MMSLNQPVSLLAPVVRALFSIFGLYCLFGWPSNLYARADILPDSVKVMSESEQVEWLAREARVLSDQNNYLAYNYSLMGEELALKMQDTFNWLEIRSGLVRLLLVEGYYDESLELNYEGKKVAKELPDTSSLIELLYWESGAYNEMGEYERSIEVSKEAIQLQETRDFDLGYAWAQNSLGEAYRYNEEYEKAEPFYLAAYEFFLSYSREGMERYYHGILPLENNLAHLYLGMKDYPKAQEYLDKLHSNSEELLLLPVLLEGNLCQVKVWEETGMGTQAVELGLEMIESAKENNYPKYELSYADWLSEYFRSTGDYKMALEFQDRGNRLRDEEHGVKARFRMTMQESELENLTLRNKNEVLEAEGKVQFRFNIALGGILILLIILAWVQLRNNRKMRNLNTMLHGQNERLDEANREINGLIGIVAHDLKAPLTKSIMLAEMLKEQVEEDQQKLLDMIQKTCGNGGLLIQDLLEISSLEAEQTPVQAVEVGFKEMVSETVEGFVGQSEKKKIGLHFESDNIPENLVTDPHLVRRILDNLISNAIKFTKSGGNVWITLSQNDQYAGISIRDEGPGIGPDDQKKMFGKFQRLSAQPTGGESSNGLGLSIVKALVDRLKIKMEFESELGKGTEFKLWLPFNRSQSA